MKQTKKIFMSLTSKSFVLSWVFMDRDMRKKYQFLFFPKILTFCGSNFEFKVRRVKFENFETGKNSYIWKQFKLLIYNKNIM